MGQGFLMDTNVVIDYLSNQLPPIAASTIDQLPGIISVITRIELLGIMLYPRSWQNFNPLLTMHTFII